MARGHRSAVHHLRRAHAQREVDVQQSAHRPAVPAPGLRQLHVAPRLGDRRGLRQLHVHGLERLRVRERDHIRANCRQVYTLYTIHYTGCATVIYTAERCLVC